MSLFEKHRQDKVLLLSIDGGGIRGAVSAKFLSCLESELNLDLHDTFDMLAGSSIGAYIATAIATQQNDGARISDLYDVGVVQNTFSMTPFKKTVNQYAPWLFYLFSKPKYDGVGKTNFLKSKFGDKKFKDIEKPLLVTAFNFIEKSPSIFKTDGKRTATINPSISQLIDASTAAPSYFPVVKLGEEYLIDGGVVANDPSICLLTYALQKGYTRENIYMLSIGTGIRNRHILHPKRYAKRAMKWNATEWMLNGLMEDYMDGSGLAAQYLLGGLLGDRYHRVKYYLNGVKDELDDFSESNVKNLIALADKVYDEQRETVIALLRASEKL